MSSTSAPHVSTPYSSVVKLLRLCELAPQDVLVDLGSGEGAVPALAAFVFGAKRAVGIELDSTMVGRSQEMASALRLGRDRVEFLRGDIFSLDLGEFDVVTIFQSQETIARLLRKLFAELRRGTRVVSYLLPLGSMSPLKLVRPARVEYPFYLYTAPLEYLGEEEAVRMLREIAGFAEGSEREWALVSASVRG
jgi:SAM-dependent methyltransferase